MHKLLLAITLLLPLAWGQEVRGTGWWHNMDFGVRVHFDKASLPGSTLVVRGISNDRCMQAVEDDAKRPFHLIYQHLSPDGYQCEERWCFRDIAPVYFVHVWGSAIWPTGVRHSVSVTEFPLGVKTSCPDGPALKRDLFLPFLVHPSAR